MLTTTPAELAEHARSEHVMEHMLPLLREGDQARLAGLGVLSPKDSQGATPHVDPSPEQAPSQQVCLSSRAVLLSACVYAYVL